MSRCWLKGAVGDTINAVLSAAGYNLRWLLRAVAAGTIKAFYFAQILWRRISAIRRDAETHVQKRRSAAFGMVTGVRVFRPDLCGLMW